MNAASLHSALFGDATEAEVGRRIGRFRLFNVAMGFLRAVQGAAILVLATSRRDTALPPAEQGGRSLVRRAVDTFAEQVSMSVVLGILLDHVQDDRAHRHDVSSHHDGVLI